MRAALGSEEAPREELRESIIVMTGAKIADGERSLCLNVLVLRDMLLPRRGHMRRSNIYLVQESQIINSMLTGRPWRRASDEPFGGF